MIQVRLPDGAIKSVRQGTTPLEIAASISEGLARNVLSASYNGEVVETSTHLQVDGVLILYTWNDAEGKKAFWHVFLNIFCAFCGSRNTAASDISCHLKCWTLKC